MNHVLQWLNMGGYGIYVWLSYGLVFMILIGNLWNVQWEKKRIFKRLRIWLKNTKSSETSDIPFDV